VNEEDFIKEEPVEVSIGERKFRIRELSGEEADQLANKYVKIDAETGNIEADISERNKFWLGRCVVDAPYEVEGKKFKDLPPEKKAELLNKLKPGIRLPLIQAVSDLNNVGSDVAKNYKKQS